MKASICKNCSEPKHILLSDGSYTIVDTEDFYFLVQFKWATENGYVGYRPRIKGKRHVILMHRIITNCPEDKVVDHINGDKKDNRKINLRIVTQRENLFNYSKPNKSSKFRGVLKSKGGQYAAQIKAPEGSKNYLGVYRTEIEAAAAFNKEALRLYGENAFLNFIPKNINNRNFVPKRINERPRKLDSHSVSRIKSMLQHGKRSQTEIARIFRVDQSLISHIARGKIWA